MATILSLFPARIAFVNADGTLTPEAYRALQTLMVRVGGPVAPTINELDAQQYADAGIEETRAMLYAVTNEIGSAPGAVPMPADDPLMPPVCTVTVDSLQSDINDLRETVARLATQINDLNQGKS